MGIYKLRESVRRILNLQQKDSPVIGSRLVFHFGGYDPVSPTKMYSRFVRELTRFRQTWSVASSASALLVAADRAKWTIVSNGPNWRVETDHQLFRWDDIMAGYAHRPVWWRLPMGLLAFADFVAGGVLWGYARTNWRYALFFLYPYLLLLVMVVASSYAAELAARTSGSIAIGIAAGVLTFIAFSRVRISDTAIRNSSAGLMRWPTRSSQQPVRGRSTRSFSSVTVSGRCWPLTCWIGPSAGSPILDPAVRGLPS